LICLTILSQDGKGKAFVLSNHLLKGAVNMPTINWKQTSGYWWPKQMQPGVCGYYCCGIVAALVKPELSRFRLSVKLARHPVWASRQQVQNCLLKDFKVRSTLGGNERDAADTERLDGAFNSVSKKKPMIVSCVGPFEGQNHWVVITQKMGKKVLIIDPYVGPIWGDTDGFKPNYLRGNALFAGLFVKVN